MKEIPILMSTEMVQATLAGRKTKTRRKIKPQPVIDEHSGRVFDGHKPAKRSPFDIHNWKEPFADYFSRWKVGNVLWVREKWKHNNAGIGFPIDYFANNETYTHPEWEKWKPSIHMKKEHARIWLEVMDIQIERLQDISEEDAKAEGAEQVWRDAKGNFWFPASESIRMVGEHGDFKTGFRSIWQSINGEESWKQNPWVWVIQFKVLSTTGRPDPSSSRKARKFERLIGFNGESGTCGNS
jgi:hypothetical protein